ncbi:MAG: 30S ribosomal protein S2 [Patescibacteria group bacterium]
MQNIPSLTEMLEAGVHFGHQKSRWHPKMAQYLMGVRNGVHVIDLDKTVEALKHTLEFVKNLAAKGKVVLFVGTKRQAREAIKAAALSCGMPYLTERWIGGLITNFEEFKRRMKKYKGLKEMMATGEIEKYVKKEQVAIKKEIEKMDRYLSGLTNLEKIPEAIYIADLRVEKTALAEAERVKVPVIGVCDSNVDPTKVEYPIPANDDAVNSIRMIVGLVAEAINEGKAVFEKNKVEAAAMEKKSPAKAQVFASEKSAPKAVATTPKTERRALKKEVAI